MGVSSVGVGIRCDIDAEERSEQRGVAHECGRLVPTLPTSGIAGIGRSRPESSQIARTCPISPELVRNWPKSPDIARHTPEIGRNRPKLAEFAGNWPNRWKFPEISWRRAKLAEIARNSLKSGEIGRNLAKLAEIAQHRATGSWSGFCTCALRALFRTFRCSPSARAQNKTTTAAPSAGIRTQRRRLPAHADRAGLLAAAILGGGAALCVCYAARRALTWHTRARGDVVESRKQVVGHGWPRSECRSEIGARVSILGWRPGNRRRSSPGGRKVRCPGFRTGSGPRASASSRKSAPVARAQFRPSPSLGRRCRSGFRRGEGSLLGDQTGPGYSRPAGDFGHRGRFRPWRVGNLRLVSTLQGLRPFCAVMLHGGSARDTFGDAGKTLSKQVGALKWTDTNQNDSRQGKAAGYRRGDRGRSRRLGVWHVRDTLRQRHGRHDSRRLDGAG